MIEEEKRKSFHVQKMYYDVTSFFEVDRSETDSLKADLYFI